MEAKASLLTTIKEIEDTESLLSSKLKYLIVGEGELEKQLKKLANNLGLAGKIIFSGFKIIGTTVKILTKCTLICVL